MSLRIILVWSLIIFLSGCAKAPTEVVEITWAVGKDPAGTNTKLVEMFNQSHPRIKVNLVQMPQSATAQHNSYVTYLAAQDPSIDVYTIDIIWPAEFAQAGWIIPLDSYFPKHKRMIFLKGPIQGCTYKGRLYAVPWFTDAGLLYYRKDLLEKEGLIPPATWQELLSQATLLKEKYGVYGYVFQGKQYEGLICNFLELLWSHGADVINQDGEVVIDSPAGRQALQLMVDLVNLHKLTPPGVTTYKEEESRRIFTEGKAAFLRNWPYVWTMAQSPEKGSKVVGKVGIAPLPHAQNPSPQPSPLRRKKGRASSSCLGGWNLAISEFSQHKNEAWSFVEFLISYDSQKFLALKGGRLPTREDVFHNLDVLAVNPHYKDLFSVFVSARPRPVTPHYPEISDIMQVEIHQALTRKKTPEETLTSINEKIRKILE